MIETKKEQLLSYDANPAISNSDIGIYIAQGIEHFLAYKGSRTSSGYRRSRKFYDVGSCLHHYILQNKTFKDAFLVQEKASTGKMIDFIRSVAALVEDTGLDIENATRIIYDKSDFSLPYDTVMTKFNSPDKQKIFETFLSKPDLTIVSTADMSKVTGMVNAMYASAQARQLLPDLTPVVESLDTSECYNELEIYWKLRDLFGSSGETIDCKSKIDRLILDPDEKHITIVDIKTTSEFAVAFGNSYRKYHYYRQMAFYIDAVTYWLEFVKKSNPRDWTIEFKFIVVEKDAPHTVRVFQPVAIDLAVGRDEYISAVMELNWYNAHGATSGPITEGNNGFITVTAFDYDTVTISDFSDSIYNGDSSSGNGSDSNKQERPNDGSEEEGFGEDREIL